MPDLSQLRPQRLSPPWLAPDLLVAYEEFGEISFQRTRMKRLITFLVVLLLLTCSLTARTATIGTLNGVINPFSYPGEDIGARINSAITANPNGAIIQIPQGVYSYTTTIQCPVTGKIAQYIIRGTGRAADNTTSTATVLKYRGAGGDAINQLITTASDQNSAGCVFEDFTLDGAMSGGNGIHFGGTTYTEIHDVTIQNFTSGNAVLIENARGMFTERFNIDGTTSLYNNVVGVKFVVDTGASTSMAHGNIWVWANINQGQIGILTTGATSFIDSIVSLNGNVGGTNTGTELELQDRSQMLLTEFNDNMECNAASSCVRLNVASGATFGGIVNHGQKGGTFTDTISGSAFLDADRSYLGLLGHLTFYNLARVAPSVSSCGSGPNVSSHSTDSWGLVTIGTGAVTSCTVRFINFPSVWRENPFCLCQVSNVPSVQCGAVATTTTMTLSSTVSMGGDNVTWVCGGSGP
jgi:hypothetical protein